MYAETNDFNPDLFQQNLSPIAMEVNIGWHLLSIRPEMQSIIDPPQPFFCCCDDLNETSDNLKMDEQNDANVNCWIWFVIVILIIVAEHVSSENLRKLFL